MIVSASSVTRAVGSTCVVGYVFFGLAISAVTSVSKLAVVFALVGLGLMVQYAKRFPSSLVAYAVAYLAIVSSWLWAPHSEWTSLGNYVTAFCGALLVGGAVKFEWMKLSTCLFVLLLPFVVNVAAYALGINFTADLYDVSADAGFKRFSGFVGHPSPFVMRLTLPLVLATLLILAGKIRADAGIGIRLLLMACAGSALFSVFVSGSKKAILIVAICILFGVLGLLRGIHRRTVSKVAFVAVAVAAGSVWVLQAGEFEALLRLQQMLGGDDSSTEDRRYLVLLGIDLFAQKPLFGHGLDEFSYLSRAGYYSHNNLIELLVSGGVFVAACYYLLVAWCVAGVWRWGSPIAAAFLTCIVLINDVTGVSASDRAVQILIVVSLAVAVIGRLPVSLRSNHA